ncbi:hypothetical protein BLA29_006380, partial [Euroglyphus maynei]
MYCSIRMLLLATAIIIDTIDITIEQSWPLSDGDCLDFHSYEHFRYSPNAHYNPGSGIDGVECARICSESSLPHAGLIDRRYCLCASDLEADAIRVIPKVTSDLCDQNDYYIRYYHGEPQGVIHSLKIRLRKDVLFVEEDIYFDLVPDATGPLEYKIDFGDDSDSIDWTPANTLKHYYHLSGTYTVTVEARLITRPSVMIKQTRHIRIESKVTNDHLKIECPKVVEPDDKVDCNVLIKSGTRMQMKIGYGDGEQSGLINLPDVPMKYIGVNIPKENNSQIMSDHTLQPSDLVVFSIPQDTLGLYGTILAIEGYG